MPQLSPLLRRTLFVGAHTPESFHSNIGITSGFSRLHLVQKVKMRQLSFDRSNVVQTASITLLTVAALVLFALVAVYWTWEWFAPRPEPHAQVVANAGGHAKTASGLFGNLELKRDRSSVSSTGIAIKLLGIVADTVGGRGYAVMQIEPKKILAVREGEDITPGIRLVEVGTDHVILERGGSHETVTWPEKKIPAMPVSSQINK